MAGTKPKLLVDLYLKRLKRIDSTPEARLLRYEISCAVDAYARYLERHGLKVHISLGCDTEPPDNTGNVIVRHDWDSVRRGNHGGEGRGGNAA